MTANPYERLLVVARRDLKESYRTREELDRRIAKLRQTVVTLGALCEQDPLQTFRRFVPRGANLTDAVENAIMATSEPLSAADIRGVLEDLGYRFQSNNPLASIHSVINRLLEQKRIERVYRVKPDGIVERRERKYWFGMLPPPEPWVEATRAKYDKTKRVWIVGEKEDENTPG